MFKDVWGWNLGPTTTELLAQMAGYQYKPQQTITMKITNAFKKFLSADLQAAVKAGYRDDGLNLTPAGQNAAIEALLDATPAAQTAFTASANEIVRAVKVKLTSRKARSDT